MHQIPASNAVARSAGSIFYLPINDLTRSSALLRDVYLQIRTDTTGQACIATYSVLNLVMLCTVQLRSINTPVYFVQMQRCHESQLDLNVPAICMWMKLLNK